MGEKYFVGSECGIQSYFVCSLVAKLCPTLSTPWTIACQAPLSILQDSPGKNTGVGCHFLLHILYIYIFKRLQPRAGDGREFQNGGVICIPMADSC